ncbi:MAG: OmpH family outer membrane protein [Prevotella sp.]|nr:OmpH family outer membrane protein [Prevotella sp.]
MKKNITKTLTLVAIAAVMASCNNQPSKMDGASASADGASAQGMRIAFVELDSLTEHYEYAKEMKDSLEKMSANANTVLSNKEKELQRSENSIRTKLQNNGFTSEQQYNTAVAALEQERNNAVALASRLNNELQQKQADFLKAMQDSLDNFLADYNKDKKYDIILNKAMILHSDQKFDITQDVINGMNNRYKKQSAKKDEAKPKEEEKK